MIRLARIYGNLRNMKYLGEMKKEAMEKASDEMQREVKKKVRDSPAFLKQL